MVLVRTLQEIYFDFTAKAKELPFQFCDYKYYCCLPKAFFITSLCLPQVYGDRVFPLVIWGPVQLVNPKL